MRRDIMDPRLVDNINILSVLIFVVLAALIAFKIGTRYLRYRRESLAVPELLPRDFWLMIGLVIPFFGVLVFRATGINARAEDWYPIWAIGSDVFAVGAMINWFYYEYFRIEK
jgi:hypothetical protein